MSVYCSNCGTYVYVNLYVGQGDGGCIGQAICPECQSSVVVHVLVTAHKLKGG